MTKPTFKLTTAIALTLAAPALADGPVLVTSTADSGTGSLRAALEAAASATAPVQIAVAAEGDIEISSGLVYEGTQPLTLIGLGQTIMTGEDVTLLTSANGADMTIQSLDFVGPGGFSITARGDLDGSAGKGIFVDVRDDQTGTVALALTDVLVADVAGHGIHVSDCSLADDCGGGGGGAGEGSDSSILVTLNSVVVDNVGNGRFDADGLRVDERGAGDIRVVGNDIAFHLVGADGAELDEGQDGDVIVDIANASFTVNGAYCHPDLLGAFMPAEDEGEFEAGQTAEDAIPGPITGSPDDRCFEREVDLYDDGSVEAYAFGIDVDDGFDVDEAGPGSILATIRNTEINDNFDEGLDYDEEDAGSIVLTVLGFDGTGNTDDAIKMSEEGEGDVLAITGEADLINNGGVGAVFEEADEGNVVVLIGDVLTVGNDDGELGLEVVQEDDGAGALTIVASTFTDGVEYEGVDFSEE